MPLVVADLGLKNNMIALQTAFNSGAFLLKLFKNNVTPDRTFTLASFTEADFNGYSPISLTSWAAPTLSAHVVTTTHPGETFTKAAGGTGNDIYGYFITDSTGAVMYWSERDPAAPVDMNTDGNTYTIVPKYTNESKYP